MKKNVPWHILAPSAVACDKLHLRASTHHWHVSAFLRNREFQGISYYAKKTADPDFLSPGCPNQQFFYVTALCNYITYTFTPYGMGNY